MPESGTGAKHLWQELTQTARRIGGTVERSFAHYYKTGGLRRCHLRGCENILKRQLAHVGAFNLSLMLRKLQPTLPQTIAPIKLQTQPCQNQANCATGC